MPTYLHTHDEQSASIVRNAISRTLAVVGLAGVALIHVLDAHDTFIASPYKGVLYVALIAGCLAAAAALIQGGEDRAWLATLLLPLGAFVAFVISRTVGLPQGADDIGNWWEPLGLASLFVEGALVVLAAGVLRARSTLPIAFAARLIPAERGAR